MFDLPFKMQIDAFIPAGEGENFEHYDYLLNEAGVVNKALIKIAGKPMISYILNALDEAKHVKSITIVGLNAENLGIKISKPVEFIEGGKTSFDSVLAAVTHFTTKSKATEYIMAVSCDIPLITGEMIDRYIETIDWSKDKEYYFPAVWKKDFDRHYPNVTKVPLRLKEGKLFSGDLHIFKPSVFSKNKDTLQDILANRKKYWKLVKIVSFRYIIRYLLGRLSLNIIENRLKSIYNLNGAYAIFSYPEVCADLDYIEDLPLFEELCSKPPRKLDSEDNVTIYSQYW
jgi:CTP:molybdopterin cytidylyltransferase MocA